MRAIGAWSGLAGIAGAAGPFLGGYLIQTAGWRWVFLINLPLAVAVVLVATRHVPESRNPDASHSPGPAGSRAGRGRAGLADLRADRLAGSSGLGSPMVLVTLFVGVAGLAAFVWREATARAPMLPLGIFKSRLFTATNLVTFAVYGALGGVFLFLVLTLQVVAGYSPLAAGSALIPMTVLLLLLSSRMGALATRIGPRLPMTVGPLLSSAAAVLLAVRVDSDTSYLRRRAAGGVAVRPGHVLHGGPADRDRARRRAGPARRHRQRGQQRGGPGRGPARRGRPAAAGRAGRCGLCRPGAHATGVPVGDDDLRRPACRRAGCWRPGWCGRRRRPTSKPVSRPSLRVPHHFHCPVDGPALEHCPQDGPLLTRPRSPTA